MITFHHRGRAPRSLAMAFATVFTASAHAQSDEASTDDMIATYGDIAEAAYRDAHLAATRLQSAVNALVESPSADTLQAARDAWRASRVPYMQTEVYRFGNAIVDEWEGRVNAWPLDEGLIDYVAAEYGTESEENAFYAANVIANPELFVGGERIDASMIDANLLENVLHEAGAVEANVGTGYHAIEFLLWGQDLNGTGAGAGERPATDFDTGNCTHGHCERRAAYLTTATDLLLDDLQTMVDAWSPEGAARVALTDLNEPARLGAVLTGMGSLSYGELAGERMQLGLMLHDPEEEHDCFADNTAASHYYNGIGIQNVYLGRYAGPDDERLEGTGVHDLVAAIDPALAVELEGDIAASVDALGVLLERQASGEAYDQLIAPGNDDGNRLVQAAIDALKTQTRSIERAVAALEADTVTIEGSDSLDDPAAVF